MNKTVRWQGRIKWQSGKPEYMKNPFDTYVRQSDGTFRKVEIVPVKGSRKC